MMKKFNFDKIIFTPDDVDLSFSPLRGQVDEPTYVLGAFNPGFSRLPNGNLILMIRVAEALKHPIREAKIRSVRWDEKRAYLLDSYNVDEVDTADPRKFLIKKYLPTPVLALTSLSWILPVELNEDGSSIVNIHYDKIIAPQKSYQEYGVEDARISLVDGKYYMTTCSVSSERHSTTLYSSNDGLNYELEGIILDHQNKDMLLFEGTINGMYYALTRPSGSLYFATPPGSGFSPGPSINLAQSPDLLHWKPLDEPFLRLLQDHPSSVKIGGGTQPILTPDGWLILFHGVEKSGPVGIYKTFWALLDKDNPQKIVHLDIEKPVMQSSRELTKDFKDKMYVEDVIFTTGIVDHHKKYIVASGELDLCCRITHIDKEVFRI